MNHSFFLTALCAIVLLSSCSSIQVIPLKEVDNHLIENDVLIYTLPKNVIRVDAEIIENNFKKGPFAEYADQYLGISNVALKDSFHYTLDKISISIYSEPDSDEIYLINAGKKKRLPSILLTSQGIIQSINASPTSEYYELAKNKSAQFNQSELDDYFVPLTKGQYLKNDTVFKTIQTDSSTIRIPVVNKSYVAKTNKDKAHDLAKILLDMREEKFSMLIGDLEEFPEGETFQTIMKEFEKLEKDYLPLFTGTTSIKKHTIQKDITPLHPDKQENQLYPVFAFNQKDGFIDLKGANEQDIVYLEISPATKVAELNKLYQQLDTSSSKKHGVYYRVPEMVILTIKTLDKELMHGRTPLAQHGNIARQPLQTINNKRLYMEFDTDWGNIIQVNRHLYHRFQ